MPKTRKSKGKKRTETVRISFEVEPFVEANLRLLCRHFGLPYPEGIAVVLEKVCALVKKRGRK